MRAGRRGRISSSLVAVLLAGVLAGCISGTDEEALDAAHGPDPGSVFSDTTVFPGVYDTTGPYSRPLLDGIYGILEPEVVELASDVDGAPIQMGIVRPDVPKGTGVPVIVDASPYYDPLTPERIKTNPHSDQIVWWTFDHYRYFAERLVPHGYAVAFLAQRGTGGSGGCMEDARAATQGDFDLAVTWLGTQEWSNGNVGMVGISYEGYNQWMTAATGNPHLKTIVPIAMGDPGPASLYAGEGAVGAGTGTLHFYLYGLGVEPGALWGERDVAKAAGAAGGRSPEQRARAAVCPEGVKGQAAGTYGSVALERDPVGFTDAWDIIADVEANYRGSVFIVNGLTSESDMRIYPWITSLEARGTTVKHLLGQWGHAYPEHRIFAGQDETHKRWDFAEILLRWFDRWLKEDATVDIGPAVQVQDSLGQWRSEATWPPADAVPRPLHLTGDAGLRSEPPAAATATLCPGVGNAGTALSTAAGCEASLRFATEPAESPWRFAGPTTLQVHARPHGPGGQLHAWLGIEGSDGFEVLREAQLDIAAGGGSFGRVVAPGEPRVATLRFAAADVVVPAGARLVMELWLDDVAAGGMGFFGPGVELTTSAAPVDIRFGGDVADASALTLLVLNRDDQGPDFFEPPGLRPNDSPAAG